MTTMLAHDQHQVMPSSSIAVSPTISPLAVHSTFSVISPLNHTTVSPSVSPYSPQFSTTLVSSPLTKPVIPVNPSTLQPQLTIPMFVLPVLPITEQFQSYVQYLEAYDFWLRWHQVNAPGSLNTFSMCQFMN